MAAPDLGLTKSPRSAGKNAEDLMKHLAVAESANTGGGSVKALANRFVKAAELPPDPALAISPGRFKTQAKAADATSPRAKQSGPFSLKRGAAVKAAVITSAEATPPAADADAARVLSPRSAVLAAGRPLPTPPATAAPFATESPKADVAPTISLPAPTSLPPAVPETNTVAVPPPLPVPPLPPLNTEAMPPPVTLSALPPPSDPLPAPTAALPPPTFGATPAPPPSVVPPPAVPLPAPSLPLPPPSQPTIPPPTLPEPAPLPPVSAVSQGGSPLSVPLPPPSALPPPGALPPLSSLPAVSPLLTRAALPPPGTLPPPGALPPPTALPPPSFPLAALPPLSAPSLPPPSADQGGSLPPPSALLPPGALPPPSSLPSLTAAASPAATAPLPTPQLIAPSPRLLSAPPPVLPDANALPPPPVELRIMFSAEAPASIGGEPIRKPQPPAEKRLRPKSTFIPSSVVTASPEAGTDSPQRSSGMNITPLRNQEGRGSVGGATVKSFRAQLSKAQLESTSETEIKRQEVMHELIHTEKQYVDGLTFLVQHLLQPCREKDLLSRESLAAIFLNVEALYNVNSQFLKELDELQKKSASPPLIDGLGPPLLKWAPQFKLYAHYCSNHQGISEAIESMRRSNKRFVAFLDEAMLKEEAKSQTLAALQTTPVQRICKYPLLLKELLKHTPPEHADSKPLQEAKQAIEDIVSKINERTRQVEGVKKVEETMAKLTKPPKGLELAVLSRRLLDEGAVKVRAKDKDEADRSTYWFLFSDVLLETKARSKENRYKPLRHTPISTLFVREATPPVDTQLELLYGGEGAVLVTFDTGTHKQRWFTALSNAVNAAHQLSAAEKERHAEIEKRKPSSNLTESQEQLSVTPVKKGGSNIGNQTPSPGGSHREDSQPGSRSGSNISKQGGSGIARPAVSPADPNMDTTLLDAVKSGSVVSVTEALSRRKELINVTNAGQMTPLHLAAQAGNLPIAKQLVDAGANINAQDKLGYTAAHYAAVVGHVHVVRQLLDAKFNTVLKTENGQTVLHVLMAAPLAKEMKPVFRSCVQDVARSFRFDINAKTDKGLTAAHHGAKRARRWNVKVLLMCNPDLNLVDQNGEGPLHAAARQGDAKLVQMLLDRGAEPFTKSKNGTPVEIAQAAGHSAVVALLTPGGKPAVPANSTPASLAASVASPAPASTTPLPRSQSVALQASTSNPSPKSGIAPSQSSMEIKADKTAISAPSGFRAGALPPELMLAKSLTAKRIVDVPPAAEKPAVTAAPATAAAPQPIAAADKNPLSASGTLERSSGTRATVTPPGTLEKKQPAPFTVTDEHLKHALQENQQLRAEVLKKEKELESLKAELALQREQNKKLKR